MHVFDGGIITFIIQMKYLIISLGSGRQKEYIFGADFCLKSFDLDQI